MRLLLLGGSSVSGQGFSATVREHCPHAEIVNLNRSELEVKDAGPSAASLLKERLIQTLNEVAPTHIVNFLGSFSNEFATDLLANVVTPHALLDAAVCSTPQASIVLIGSAAEYGRIANPDNPVSESDPLAPVSVYGLTKMMQSVLVPFYTERFSLNVKLARTFNIIAPKLSTRLFVGRVFQQIEEIKAGERAAIEVGSLDDERDYISLQDATRDYLRILLHGAKGEAYNVCSGKSTRMLDLLKMLLDEAGLPNVAIKRDESVSRSMVPKIFGSRQKLDSIHPLP
jgi:GDP-4-dehydro-6-deoxy-D-mannose reductase